MVNFAGRHVLRMVKYKLNRFFRIDVSISAYERVVSQKKIRSEVIFNEKFYCGGHSFLLDFS